jgi:hypothetical protein
MTYSKPEVKTLGEAKMVIEAHVKAIPSVLEPPYKFTLNAAYDLDE